MSFNAGRQTLSPPSERDLTFPSRASGFERAPCTRPEARRALSPSRQSAPSASQPFVCPRPAQDVAHAVVALVAWNSSSLSAARSPSWARTLDRHIHHRGAGPHALKIRIPPRGSRRDPRGATLCGWGLTQCDSEDRTRDCRRCQQSSIHRVLSLAVNAWPSMRPGVSPEQDQRPPADRHLRHRPLPDRDAPRVARRC